MALFNKHLEILKSEVKVISLIFIDVLVILVQVQIILIYITGCRFVLSQPVVDKETKMRETLRILSMKTSAYGLSFFFTQAIFAFFTSIFISLTFLLIGFFQGKGFFAFIAFWMAVLVYGFSTIFMSMGLSTLFSDSKIASQIGSLVLIVPLAVYQLLLSNAEYGNDRSLYNYDYLYIGYPLPFVPMSVIITDAIALPLGD